MTPRARDVPCRHRRHPARRPRPPSPRRKPRTSRSPPTPGPRPTASGPCRTWAGPRCTSTGASRSCAGASMENGTLDLDVAASDTTNFLGRGLPGRQRRGSPTSCSCGRAPAAPRRPSSTGRHSTAWASPGRSTTATAPTRSRTCRAIGGCTSGSSWTGRSPGCIVDTATAPTLVVPRVVASGGAGLGVWAGAFGRGAYFSNIRYTAARRVRSRATRAGPAAGDDARLGAFQRDRGRRLHAGRPARSRPAHLAARRSGARRIRPGQPLPGGAGRRRADGTAPAPCWSTA